MIEFTNQVVIERPVKDVFDFVSQLENAPKWNYFVQQVRQTSPGPVGFGTSFHQIRKTFFQRTQAAKRAIQIFFQGFPGIFAM